MLFKLLMACCVFVCTVPNYVFSQRETINFDADWKFIQEDVIGAERTNFNDAPWRTLNLPHDWSIEGKYNENNPMGAQCGYLPAGIGWYRKTIQVP